MCFFMYFSGGLYDFLTLTVKEQQECWESERNDMQERTAGQNQTWQVR